MQRKQFVSLLCRTTTLAVMATVAGISVPATAQSQTYPNGPVKLVVPVAAGGGTDIAGRFLAQQLGERLGQTVVVENRPGASFVVGATYVAKQPANGQTIVLLSQTAAEVLQLLDPKLPFETLRDFVPIAHTMDFHFVLLVGPNSPAKTLTEFIAMARARPGALNFGSAGGGSMGRFSMEILMGKTGLSMQHVAFQSEQLAMTELMAGRLDAMFATVSVALPQLRAGRVRSLGVPVRQRLKFAPDLLTFAEQGVGDVTTASWFGLFAPAGTPRPIVERLNREITAILQKPEIQARLNEMGFEAGSGSADEFRQKIQTETEMWRTLVKDLKIKAD
ncbi:MAG: tripartite tricarboxylate transporter substrate binding protein [Burkholderiaceae bacterium]|nr:tripartite tricarboxylate transporter substrate binding protein [Burkholderiaceae bacterium]